MSRLNVAISCPIDCYSGYSARSRDFVRALIEAYPKWNIQILSQRWGNTRGGFLADHGDTLFTPLITPQLYAQPDIWIQITVPNEFRRVGRYNIGVTAGIETTFCDPSWIEGCNRMDLVITSSKHSEDTFVGSQFVAKDKRTEKVVKTVELQVPVEVLFEGVDLETYRGLSRNENTLDLKHIKEPFVFLVVGHWMQGILGEDRKNIGYTIKAFLETFKNKVNAPALLLKVQRTTSSLLDQEAILRQISIIRSTVRGTLPNVYLLHGDLTDSEMNMLYNHPKVKAMVSFTKGEGFGRPLLEFVVATGKPVIASGWSGQLDFLNKNEALLVGGTLENVHPSAAVEGVLLKDAQWFKPDDGHVGMAFQACFKEYKQRLKAAERLGNKNRTLFSFGRMKERLSGILEQHLPTFPEEFEITLPSLPLPSLEIITE